jgi:glycosyltransferase involved in cell wall biosynthesis
MSNRILYFHNGLSSFVQKDIDILKSEFDIKIHHFNVKNKKKVPLSFIFQKLFILRHLFSTNTYVVQFGGYHSVLPVIFARLFLKKCVIVLGGTDCVSFPSIHYGNFYKSLLGYFTKFSLKNAHLLLPVDESLVHYKYNYQSNDNEYQGYKAYIPNIKTPYKVIYNGYDASLWTSDNLEKEKNSFVTVGANLGSRFGFTLKGIDLLFDIAKLHPTCKFYIVGGSSITNKSVPDNIFLLDPIPNNKLAQFLQTKVFYLQLSISEGFPNALCEAMLCKCIPIVSSVGAMPKIVGNKGYILEKKDVKYLSKIIQYAIDHNELSKLGLEVRNVIKLNYTLEKRKKELLKSIKELVKK